MFYKPNFCCNCGEKIERTAPSVFDSNRFCDVCQHDFVGTRLLPFFYAGLMTVIGLFGVGSLWKGSATPPTLANRPVGVNRNAAMPPVGAVPPKAESSPPPSNLRSPPKRPDVPVVKDDEPGSICGAETKKGTPCSRRVKDGGRCWQHQGQNSVLSVEKSPSMR